MQTKEGVADVRGQDVVSIEEGLRVGTVSGIYIDVASRQLAGIGVRRAKSGEDGFVAMKGIRLLGADVALIHAAADVTEPSEEPLGPSLKQLQGLRVTTLDGNYLGALVDLDVSGSDWRISELRLADRKRVTVDADEITIGRDEILVPSACVERVEVVEPQNNGVLGRWLGRETIEDISTAIRRVLKKGPAESEPPEPAAAAQGVGGAGEAEAPIGEPESSSEDAKPREVTD